MENNIIYIIAVVSGLIAIIINVAFLFYTFIQLKKQYMYSQYCCYLVFFLFFIFPLILTHIFGKYKYRTFYMANNAIEDNLSNSIYNLFIILFPIILFNSCRKEKYKVVKKEIYNKTLLNICYILEILPFLVILLSSLIKGKGLLFIFGMYGSRFNGNDDIINETLIGLAVISYLIILSTDDIKKRTIILSSIIMGLYCWLVAKRYIVVEIIIMSIYTISISNKISGRKLIKYLMCAGTGLISFCYIYGIFIKKNLESLLEYFYVDLSRQYTLIYQFYCESIGRAISISEYDAIRYIVFFWIPRSFWEKKPYPFVNSLTKSLIGVEISGNTNLGWATTCSFFSDLFDSFSYVGLLIGVLIIVSICKKINKTEKIYYKILLLYVVIRLLTVQISSCIIQIVIIYILVLISDLIGKKIIKFK